MAAAEPKFPTSSSSASFPYSTSQSQRRHYQASGHRQPPQPIYNRNIPFVRRLIVALTISFIIITSISLISWLILHPHLPLVRINSLSVSNFSLPNTLSAAKYQLNFTITNPNRKIFLDFKSYEVIVSLKRIPLSRTCLSPFHLEKMNRTVQEIELVEDPIHGFSGKKRLPVHMGGDGRSRVVNFSVRMAAVAKFKVSDWLGNQRSIDVFCGDLPVLFGSDNMTAAAGKLVNPAIEGRDCSVDLF